MNEYIFTLMLLILIAVIGLIISMIVTMIIDHKQSKCYKQLRELVRKKFNQKAIVRVVDESKSCDGCKYENMDAIDCQDCIRGKIGDFYQKKV